MLTAATVATMLGLSHTVHLRLLKEAPTNQRERA